ncbi:MAG TPA: ribonuclease T [Pasteurellaceae bacterium]|nr:ribonuclease T [Pasteurellaceae bacterium]
MKQKQILHLCIFVICSFILLFVGWFYLPSQKQTVETVQAAEIVIESDYDYIMKNDPIGQNTQAKTDYFTLVLSWSPSFCDTQRQRYGDKLPTSISYQCGSDQQFGWIIHGLWPQNAKARRVSDHPRFCQGDLPKVANTIIKEYLPESPSARLLQGEWEKHGACAFDTAESYFKKQRNLYRTLRLPDDELSKTELFRWMKKNNPQLKDSYLGASHNELFICYDLDFNVMNCPRAGSY